jgi:hypothetical protein
MAEKEKTTILQKLIGAGFPVDVIQAATERLYTKYIAELILSSESIAARSAEPWEYKSLLEFGEEDFIFHGNTFWAFNYENSSKKPDVNGWHKGAITEMTDCVWRNVIYEEDGLQFYVKNPDGTYRLAQAGDRSYDLIHEIAADTGLDAFTYYAPPKWWTDLHLGQANYESYDLVFSSCPSTNDPRYPWFKKEKAAVVHRETALRLSVPFESTPARAPCPASELKSEMSVPSNVARPKGNLMHIAGEVQGRFWGDNFDSDDRATWTSQDVILGWIRERQPGISDSNAKAIEKVACPVDRSK